MSEGKKTIDYIKNVMFNTKCCPRWSDYIDPFRLSYLTISVNVHRAGVPFPVVVSVYLSGVVFIGAVVAAVANFILVKVKLARIVK